MPPPSKISPVTSEPVPDYYIHSSSLHFQDTSGRSLLLRGVNLSGAAKAPVNTPSWSQEGFWEDAEAGKLSFIGRPLDLEDGSADVHLSRLRAWGFNMLRFVFTWEAIEHAGPGKYDTDYIDYVVQVLYKCKEYGFRVYMDPHQDVWSRFSGGSGAPLWTLYACGIDPQAIVPTYSALVHCDFPSKEEPRPAEFPAMIWSTNYTRLFCQTIFTLFYAGKTYAPKCIIDGINIQDYLQNHFIEAVGVLAKRIGDAGGLYDECVIGWDSMNEPGEGYIGHGDLGQIPKEQQLKKGPSPTPFEGMRLGMGEAVEVAVWDFGPMGPRTAGTKLIDPAGQRLWLKAEDEITRGGGKWGWTRSESWILGTCIWAQHGVWDPVSSTLLQPDYFKTTPENPEDDIEFVADFWRLHWLSYASTVRLYHPEAIHFIQAPVFKPPPKVPESFLMGRACTAPHYYDGLTLMTKHWNWFNADALGLIRGKYWNVIQAVRIGEAAIRRSIQDQLGILKQDTKDVLGDYPTLIGEIGCPYDMDDKKTYGYVDGGKGEGDYSSQQKAWDCSLNAADGPNCLNWTLWTYVPDNSHEWGDLWNGEDLSIWSPDDIYESAPEPPSNESRSSLSATPEPTSSVASSATLAATKSSSKAAAILSGEGVTPALILNGARAVGAFCRPYPTATVGIPERLDFDIASTSFKLSVKVRPDDISSSNCTEIYIPFVHYAASLSKSRSSSYTPSSPYPESTRSTITYGSDASLIHKQNQQSISEESKIQLSAEDSAPNSRSPSPTLSSPSSTSLTLDVSVQASTGSYEISGQTLKWIYEVPKQEEGEQVYTIEVKRNGGAIKLDDEVYVQNGSWAEVCPPGGCVIS